MTVTSILKWSETCSTMSSLGERATMKLIVSIQTEARSKHNSVWLFLVLASSDHVKVLFSSLKLAEGMNRGVILDLSLCYFSSIQGEPCLPDIYRKSELFFIRFCFQFRFIKTLFLSGDNLCFFLQQMLLTASRYL